MMSWKYLPGGTGKKDAMMEERQNTAKGEYSIWSKIWKENHKTFPPIKRNFIFFFYQLYISNLFNFLLKALNFCYILATEIFPPLMCLISSISTKGDTLCSSPWVTLRNTGIVSLDPSREGYGLIIPPIKEFSKTNKVDYWIIEVCVQKSLWKEMKPNFLLLTI